VAGRARVVRPGSLGRGARPASLPIGCSRLSKPARGLRSTAVSGIRFRLIGTADSELGIVSYPVQSISEAETVHLPGGRSVPVIEVCADEQGREGDVCATVVVDA
jgi:hypothetical protein